MKDFLNNMQSLGINMKSMHTSGHEDDFAIRELFFV